jgi:AcrR family transcriptional regulator
LQTRRRKQAELKSNIAAATAVLHASKGAAATSYADIARQAGVSLPTVYKHFPTEDALFLGCTSHVASRAPAFAIDQILGANNLSTAIEMLVDAIEEQHLYYQPWLAWRMEGYVSFLDELSVGMRIQQTEMVTIILQHFLGPAKHRKMAAGCETVLCFDFWHRLVHGHRLSRPGARQIMIQSLQAIVGLQPTSKSASKPRRKS